MLIRYVNRDYVKRFGKKSYKVPDDTGAGLVRRGIAEAVISSVGAPPVSKVPSVDAKPKIGTDGSKSQAPAEKVVKGDVVKRKQQAFRGFPRVGWVHDSVTLGGAELSNQTVIAAGEQLGFNIYQCYPGTFDKHELARCDLLIINNFFHFEMPQMHFILDLLFEYKRPFVKYDHDHREIMGDQARPKLARLLFGRSILNVFISPFHADNFRKALGDIVEPYFLLPPAIDTGIFKLIPEVERDPNKVVNVTGRLYESKGFRHVLHFCLSREGKNTFEVYTRNHQAVKNTFGQMKHVEVFPLLPNETLPKIYNSAGFVLHLPHALEACGRTVAEGLLCGCQPIINKNVGIQSFKGLNVGDQKKFNPDLFRRVCKQGIWEFWKAVELKFYGY